MTVSSSPSRRMVCSWQPESASHAGLWFDRGIEQIPSSSSKDQLFAKHAKDVAAISEPLIYASFMERWKQQLDQHGTTLATAQTLGRLALGLGGASVIETGLRLHHTYGTPIIPGSALKGLTASFAHRRIEDPQWMLGNAAHTTLFGTTDQSGCVTFFDALYIPGSGHQQHALHTDVVTVHHPKYYRGEQEPPADWDSPIPVSFLTITGQFLIVLAGPKTWVDAAFSILKLALEHEGIGAKTNAGYGRMELKLPEPPKPSVDDLEAQRILTELQGLAIKDVNPRLNSYYKRWKEIPNASLKLRHDLAQAMIDKAKSAKYSKASAWFEELRAFVKEH